MAWPNGQLPGANGTRWVGAEVMEKNTGRTGLSVGGQGRHPFELIA